MLIFDQKILEVAILKFFIEFQSRCMSFPTLSDIDFQKMASILTTLNN